MHLTRWIASMTVSALSENMRVIGWELSAELRVCSDRGTSALYFVIGVTDTRVRR